MADGNIFSNGSYFIRKSSELKIFSYFRVLSRLMTILIPTASMTTVKHGLARFLATERSFWSPAGPTGYISRVASWAKRKKKKITALYPNNDSTTFTHTVY